MSREGLFLGCASLRSKKGGHAVRQITRQRTQGGRNGLEILPVERLVAQTGGMLWKAHERLVKNSLTCVHRPSPQARLYLMLELHPSRERRSGNLFLPSALLSPVYLLQGCLHARLFAWSARHDPVPTDNQLLGRTPVNAGMYLTSLHTEQSMWVAEQQQPGSSPPSGP